MNLELHDDLRREAALRRSKIPEWFGFMTFWQFE